MKHLIKRLACASMLTAAGSLAAIAQPALTLPDAGFAPEGIAIDGNGTLYTGSLTQGRIIKIASATGAVSEFAPAGANGMVSIVGLHASAGLVFACSSDPGASALTGTAAPALAAFDQASGAPAGRYPLPEGGVFCNDIAELPDGTLLVTDSFAPRIYALAPGAESLKIWLEDDQFVGEGFNLNGIAHDDGAVFVLRYNTGTLHRIDIAHDGAAGPVTQIPLPRAIAGADGLTALGDGRFLAIEGGGLHAGAQGALLGITLGDDAARIDPIAQALNVPTTTAVLGGTAYVIEGQLDHLFDPTAGPADPYRILAIDLPAAYR